MSRIKVDRITDRAGTGEPLFPNGVKVVGLTSLSNVVAGIATFENVSIGGTLTYDDVTNVDSTGIVTARGGFKAGDPSGIGATIEPNGNAAFAGIVTFTTLKVGTAVTVSNGIVTATSYRGDGSQLSGIEASPQVTGTASGAISANQPCIANSDGTISPVTQTVVPTVTSKIDTELSSDGTYRIQDTAWINSTKFIVLARKLNDSNKGRAFFGSVDGNGAITLGTPTAYAGSGNDIWNARVAVDTSTEQFLTIQMDDTNNDVYIRGGKVNSAGDGIDWGGADWWANGDGQKSCAVASNNNGEFMIAYINNSNNIQFRHVQLDSSSTISKSGNANWSYSNAGGSSANGENRMAMEYMPPSGGYWCLTQDNVTKTYPPNGVNISNGGYFRSCWAKSNGTGSSPSMEHPNSSTPFAGPAATTAWPPEQLGYEPDLSYDSNTSKGILSWRHITGGKPTAAVLTIPSNTTSGVPTYTTAVDIASNSTDSVKHTFNPSTKELVFYFATNSGSVDTEIKCFTISGNTLVDANHNLDVFVGVDYQYLAVATNPTLNRVIVATQDEGNGDYLSASTVDIPVTTNNLTAENFIGFAADNYANNVTATIKVVGNTTTQSGLTAGRKYYVQNNATLALTADTPSVEAGTAISATTLIVKG